MAKEFETEILKLLHKGEFNEQFGMKNPPIMSNRTKSKTFEVHSSSTLILIQCYSKLSAAMCGIQLCRPNHVNPTVHPRLTKNDLCHSRTLLPNTSERFTLETKILIFPPQNY